MRTVLAKDRPRFRCISVVETKATDPDENCVSQGQAEVAC